MCPFFLTSFGSIPGLKLRSVFECQDFSRKKFHFLS